MLFKIMKNEEEILHPLTGVEELPIEELIPTDEDEDDYEALKKEWPEEFYSTSTKKE